MEGALGQSGLQGGWWRGSTSGPSPGTPGEEGRHNKWRMEGPNDGDHWWALLMSVVGKVKMAALLG